MAVRDLVAAAARWTARRFGPTRQAPDKSWQTRAWDYYDTTPEARFAARWIGGAMGKARLVAGLRDDDGTVTPLPAEHRASQLVASIAGGPAGQAEMLREAGPHLVVAGEMWIVIRPGDADEDWRVLSISEVRAGRFLEVEIDGEWEPIPAPDQAGGPLAIRVWEPHPRRRIEADSPIRASLGLLEELRLLDAAVAAIARSRLVGRGVLLVPQGARFPATGRPGDQGEDDLIEVFMTVAETAYKEPESAAATVPIILEVPAETIGSFQRLTFESDFDEIAIKLREECIRRIANGLDMPSEILLGQGDINHWGIWQLQSEAIALAVEPRLGTIADALTGQWLRPLLESEGHQDAGRALVWYDTSALRVRSNRAQTALEVYDRGAISQEALRRETGFDDSDAPTPGQTHPASRPGTPGLPVDETQGLPDTLPAAALARLSDLGQSLTRRIQDRHGLDDEQTRDLVEALARTSTTQVGRVSPDTAAPTLAATDEDGAPDA